MKRLCKIMIIVSLMAAVLSGCGTGGNVDPVEEFCKEHYIGAKYEKILKDETDLYSISMFENMELNNGELGNWYGTHFKAKDDIGYVLSVCTSSDEKSEVVAIVEGEVSNFTYEKTREVINKLTEKFGEPIIEENKQTDGIYYRWDSQDKKYYVGIYTDKKEKKGSVMFEINFCDVEKGNPILKYFEEYRASVG